MKQTLPRKHFHLRGCIAVWFELLLSYANLTATGAGAYVVIRGNVEWREAQKQLAAAGYSLDMQEIVKAAVPDAENFGATPALKGIAGREEDQTPEIKAKIARLNAANPLRTQKVAPRDVAVPVNQPDKPMDWKAWRRWLAGPMKFNVPTDEPNDAKAIFAALSSRDEVLVEELVRAAAGRPRSQILPRQSVRLARSLQRGDMVPDSGTNGGVLMGPFRLLAMRAEAAMATGRPDEAVRCLPALFSIVELAASDRSMVPALVESTMLEQIRAMIQRSISAGHAETRVLRQCQEFFASRHFALSFRNALQMEMTSSCRVCLRLGEPGSSSDSYNAPTAARRPRDAEARLFRIIAPDNMAIFVRQFLESARYLDREDWVGLIEYRHRLSLQNDGFRLLGLRTLLADMMSSPIGSLLEGIVYREVNRRLCIAACALERNRLAGHEFPDTLADLPKALLPEVPLDLDKQPIRYHPTPAGFVIWSVGLNLKDDWHGDRPPDAPKSDREPKPRDILDWQWRMP